jgi:hypothetical protein
VYLQAALELQNGKFRDVANLRKYSSIGKNRTAVTEY